MSAPQSFEDLLNSDAADAVRPPPRPGGTYLVTVKSSEQVKSSRKGTPGVEFTFTDFEPQGDVDADTWEQYLESPVIDVKMDSMTDTFWITPKSKYMLKEFCEACGSSPEGRTLGQMVEDVMGAKVLATVKQTVGDRSVFANIEGYALVPE